MAVGSGSGSICDLRTFWCSSAVTDLPRRIRWHHRNRNDLVVAYSEQQTLKSNAAGPRSLAILCEIVGEQTERYRESVNKVMVLDRGHSAMNQATDYSRSRAVRLLAVALKLREKGSIEHADAVAAIALQCLDGYSIQNLDPGVSRKEGQAFID